MLDTTGRGYRLTSAANGVMFDINNDGRPDRLGWTDPSRNVGFLAFDRNQNGVIDGGHELFGNATPVGETTAEHGFDALIEIELSQRPYVDDGIVDASDAAFGRLLIWIDRNHDGVSQPSELHAAWSLGLISIETSYRKSRRRDPYGNEYRLRGMSWWKPSSGSSPEARLIYDVWLATGSRDTAAAR